MNKITQSTINLTQIKSDDFPVSSKSLSNLTKVKRFIKNSCLEKRFHKCNRSIKFQSSAMQNIINFLSISQCTLSRLTKIIAVYLAIL